VELESLNTVINNSAPNKPKQLTWARLSSSNHSSTTTHLFPINTNQFDSPHAGYMKLSNHHAMNTTNNNQIPPFLLTDNINSLVPPIYDTWANQHQRSITISNAETEKNKPQSLPNQAITFSSQPVIREPPKITQPNKKIITRGTNNKHTTRTKPSFTLTRLNLPDPTPTQARPEIKKPKITMTEKTMTEIDPTFNPDNQAANQEKEDMEVQGEKKRRREDEKLAVINGGTEHFLTAGPGSQDCRDQ
jgi:hypothetical protein